MRGVDIDDKPAYVVRWMLFPDDDVEEPGQSGGLDSWDDMLAEAERRRRDDGTVT